MRTSCPEDEKIIRGGTAARWVPTFPDSLHHVMEVSHSEEEWTDYDGPELGVVPCKCHSSLRWRLVSSPSRTGTIQARKVNSSLKGATT